MVEATAEGSAAQSGDEALGTALSLTRVLRIVAPIVIVLVGCALFVTSQLPSQAERKLQASLLAALLGKPTQIEGIEFVDANSDLVADPPVDEACNDPQTLLFSYVAAEDAGEDASLWQPLVDALAEKTGKTVEFVAFERVEDQATAMRDGKLHVAAFNTGAVPLAVQKAGFVPVSTFGDSDGKFGVTMQMLVAANGPWDSLDDLKVERDELPKVEFVQPNSNSGFKAALVLLMNEYDALPEREYNYSFSMDYNKSMKNVADGKTDFAPVVSDLLEQAKAEGLIKAESVRSVYESERFPPAAFGHAHNLTPALRQKIADALVNFDWSGTAIAEQFGAAGSSRFVPVNYKDDWANIRRIDDAIEKARR